MKPETRADEIISLMESDLAGDYSDEISKGNWMKRSTTILNTKYLTKSLIVADKENTHLRDKYHLIRLIKEMRETWSFNA